MRLTVLITIITLLFYGFISSKTISKKEVKDDVEVQVKVSKNQKSKSRFYGSIEIKNKSEKRINFNFNQLLVLGADTLIPSSNFKPISYAEEAFIIDQHETKAWDVVWNYKGEQKLNDKIKILIDSSISEEHQVGLINKGK